MSTPEPDRGQPVPGSADEPTGAAGSTPPGDAAPVNPFAPPSTHRTPQEHAAPSAVPGGAAGAVPPAASAAQRSPFAPPLPGETSSAPAGPAPTSGPAPTPAASPTPGPAPTPAASPDRAPAPEQPAATGLAQLFGDQGPAPEGEDAPAATDSWGRPVAARRERRGLAVVWVVPLLVLSLLAGAAGGVVADRWSESRRPSDAALPEPVGSGVSGELEGVAAVAAAVLPSVVSIEVRGQGGQGTGSGFVLRDDGYILTNNHVVAAAADGGEVVVVLADGAQEPAEIVGRTAAYDLAVLKIDRTDLTPLVLGDSDAVVVGDPVVAIGAPLGLQGTVTTGIVSALNRPVSAGGGAEETAFINAIQTDAAINPGNSGGPLVDAAGEVIGINSAIAQRPGAGGASGSIGLGFAITSNQARHTAAELIETGSATYPVIGVLLDSRYEGEGVQVSAEAQNGTPAVTPDGPADRAGIEPGDVIVAIDGRPVTEDDELIVAIRAKAPGDAITLTVRSGDDERDVRVVLDQTTGAQ
ncbi:S1C family serine protease [Actinotalea sp. JY-7876]|uniref:S1C family serine protease n=2 Tax=unclassified Actinotalea TaxID=2638618 RepID=UPI002107FAC0|nr:trypsin-like peptidase domain-containing protein [Actinotalea sp. JY-7876]